MPSFDQQQRTAVTAAAGFTLAVAGFTVVRTFARQRSASVESLEDLEWLCGRGGGGVLRLETAVRRIAIRNSGHGGTPQPSSLKRVPSLQRLTRKHSRHFLRVHCQ